MRIYIEKYAKKYGLLLFWTVVYFGVFWFAKNFWDMYTAEKVGGAIINYQRYIMVVSMGYPIVFLRCLYGWKDDIDKVCILWGGIVFAICFLSSSYDDVIVTANNSAHLFNLVVQGKVGEFYLSDSVYSLPIYVLYLIWELPIQIFYCVKTGTFFAGTLDFWFYTYAKVLPLVFTLGTSKIVYEIAKYLDETVEKKLVYTLCLFSPIVIWVQATFGQYDVFWIFFLLLALKRLLVHRDLTQFCVLISIGASFKIFPLLCAIPIILVYTKTLKKIILSLFEILSLPIFFMLIQILAPKSELTASFMGNIIDILLECGYADTMGKVSIFVLGYAIICVVSFSLDTEAIFLGETGNVWLVYLPYLIFAFMFVLIAWHTQWLVVLVPFQVILTLRSKNLKTQIWIDVFMILCVFYTSIVCGANVGVCEYMMKNGIQACFFAGNITLNKMYDLLMIFGTKGQIIARSVFTGLLVADMILLCPLYTKGKKDSLDKESVVLLDLRTTVSLVYVFLGLLMYFTS